MKISIITTAYNSRDTIEAAIRSVLDQTWRDIEYIVVDGGSKDGTQDIARRYRNRIAKFVSKPDEGAYHGLNTGLDMATGEVVGFLHSDDILAGNEVIRKVAKAFTESRKDSVYGDASCFKGGSYAAVRTVKPGPCDRENFKKGWSIPHTAFFARKSLYTMYGNFDTTYKTSADYEMIVRLLWERRVSSAYIAEPLVNLRLDPRKVTSIGGIFQRVGEDSRIMRKYGLGGLVTSLRKNLFS